MPYVPSPSRRTRELAEKLQQAIRDYERDHPNLSPEEIQHALQVLSAPASRQTDRRALGIVAALVAIFIALGAILAEGRAGGGGDGPPWAPVAVGIAVAVLMAVVAFTKLRRDD